MVETLHLSAITVAEPRFGLASTPEGKRRTIYLDRLEGEVLPAFSGRVPSFGLDACRTYADPLGLRYHDATASALRAIPMSVDRRCDDRSRCPSTRKIASRGGSQLRIIVVWGYHQPLKSACRWPSAHGYLVAGSSGRRPFTCSRAARSPAAHLHCHISTATSPLLLAVLRSLSTSGRCPPCPAAPPATGVGSVARCPRR